MEKSAAGLIPTEVITEFIFGLGSTVTIPVTQQSNLDSLIEPADFAQSVSVELSLCRGE